MKIQLDIGELVLDGFDVVDCDPIKLALTEELTRLIKQNGLPTQLGASPLYSLNAGSFVLPSGGNPKAVGAEIARLTYRCICKK